ncbi:MAG: hypothetical protein DPW11_03360 [bacterium]|nr:hypothetical protein [Candidatus Microgenomates bacterium CPR3]MCQ3944787.1 hypothetical protein [bacterium]RIK51365.1 MAG: hypothetical protein DCC61_02875 [Candidatus Microgenomates bacterium]
MSNQERPRDLASACELVIWGGVGLMVLLGAYHLGINYDIPFLSDLAVMARGAMLEISETLSDLQNGLDLSRIDFTDPVVLRRMSETLPDTAKATNPDVIKWIQKLLGLDDLKKWVDSILGQ